MTASIEITIDAVDAEAAATFWQTALGYELLYRRGPFVALAPPAGDGRPRVLVQRVPAVPAARTRAHMDLRVDDPDGEVARLVGLGAAVVEEVDETAGGGSRWTVLSDPQGTIFCVCPTREE